MYTLHLFTWLLSQGSYTINYVLFAVISFCELYQTLGNVRFLEHKIQTETHTKNLTDPLLLRFYFCIRLTNLYKNFLTLLAILAFRVSVKTFWFWFMDPLKHNYTLTARIFNKQRESVELITFLQDLYLPSDETFIASILTSNFQMLIAQYIFVRWLV